MASNKDKAFALFYTTTIAAVAVTAIVVVIATKQASKQVSKQPNQYPFGGKYVTIWGDIPID